MISAYDRTKAWRIANREKHAQQQRRYYLNHKEEIAAYQRTYLKRKRSENITYTEESGLPS